VAPESRIAHGTITLVKMRASVGRPGRTTSAALLVAVLAVAVGCTDDVGGTPTDATFSSGVAPTPSLDRFYGQEIHWGSCADFADQDATGYPDGRSDCATVTVPIDYADPDGPVAQIAMFRLRAGGAKVGSVLINPGGPGASAVEFVAGQAEYFSGLDIADRFDLIGFDPRGIGKSTPELRCLTDEERDAQRAQTLTDTTPAGIAKIEDRARSFAQKCADRMGTQFLSHVGTADVVRDMDVIRAVLGEQQLNYLGYSYGTRIGATYAEQFPTRVRAMVNDGAVEPNADPVEDLLKQREGFQSVFDAFAADCAEKRDCALGNDPSTATARFQELTRPLIDSPVPTTQDRRLTYGDAMTGVTQAMYADTLWEPLRKGLTELADGRGSTLLRLADLYEGRAPDGVYSNISDAFTSVRCVDDPPLTDQAQIDRLDIESRRLAPFADDGRGTGRGARDSCAFWEVPPTGGPHVLDVPGLPTTVVVSTTNDPATPYQAGIELARQLGARLITFEGDQHTASLQGDNCVDEAVTAYFVDLTLPEENLRC
jgi:pimeloyl-ACP methyl ester carboxylesterase